MAGKGSEAYVEAEDGAGGESEGRMARAAAKFEQWGGVKVGVAARIGIVAGLAAWAFVLVAMVTFSGNDWPSHTSTAEKSAVTNLCGAAGSLAAYQLITMLGWGAWVLVLGVGIGLIGLAIGQRPTHLWTRLIGVVLVAVCVSGVQALAWPTSGVFPDLAGGKIGVSATSALSGRFGVVGTGIWYVLFLVVGMIVAADEVVLWAARFMRDRGVPATVVAGKYAGTVAVPAVGRASGGLIARIAALFRRGEPVEASRDDFVTEMKARAEARRAATAGRRAKSAADQPAAVFPGEMGGGLATRAEVEIEEELEEKAERLGIEDPDEEMKGMGDGDEEEEEDDDEGSVGVKARTERSQEQEQEEEDEDDLPGAPQVFDKDALREKMSKLPVMFGQNNREVATDADLAGIQSAEQLEIEGKQYRFPGMDLLENPEENFNEKLESYVREQAAALESAMQQYGIDGEVVGIESGPVITLFDVRLAPGTKVAAVSAVSSDIARALKSVNIRIVPNQVGRDTIGIEVPNTQKEKVRLKELMAKTDRFANMRLPMFMGKDASGEPLIEDLSKMPHMLIAGTTGSGKSVCMNTIIMGFLYTKKPSELKMVLVDPKMVEMSQFKDIPHLMCPVVTEMGKAAAILEWACTKMDERYELLAEAGCRDIGAYNELTWEELKDRLGITSDEEGAKVPRKLPYMVFIIDELADLMMTAKEVESHIIRIAQKARAVGMHLILATQRPQANVVTGLIKSNMPCRVAFRVASGMDSRIVLDTKGAELLLGHGDMLFLNPRTNKLTRSQGTLVDDKEIRNVVKFMKDVAGPSFERQLLQLRRPSEDGNGLGQLSDEDRLIQSKNNSSASLRAAQEDPLFERAVEIVLESRRGSVSLLQRRLAIGYTRSSRLIDLMGIAGIISDHKGSVARDVLITPEEWEMMKEMAKEEARQKGIAWPVKGKEEQGALFNGEERVRRAEDPPFERTEGEDEDENL
jgi:S-DNA-T family DNA segregation ATPase FtsK/SpoIIIE